ncbi:response regulator transcription factor [Reichenbachiella versicolor]|uniref:response regulator transcription factor n=1 Tax=Reichenbachiella versicolor TaxID=1821036 RepID=UPI000D6EAA16|nr:response regulator transcription factor [Reichenbachiella versicolor]
MSGNKKILVVDDEEDILDLLRYNLEKEGYQVKVAEDGIKGVEIAKTFVPDLILLDIMMPGQDGVETCRQMRELSELSGTFIIFLTARVEEYSEVAAFENGADDYLTKPIKPRALMSRINAIFRRSKKEIDTEEKINVGDLMIDKQGFIVRKNETEFNFPKKEFELLYFLAKHPGKVFSREDLLHNIWGSDVYVLTRTVDVHIRKVREKIGDGYISTIKGVGYKFELD